MTKEELIEAFEEAEAEDNGLFRFERIEYKRSQRPDIHAIKLLDELVPFDEAHGNDLICEVGSNRIWFGPSLEELAKLLTKELVMELHRCSVFVDGCEEKLAIRIV
jgi:hypothetical protein